MIFIFLLGFYITSIFSMKNQSVEPFSQNDPLQNLYFLTAQQQTSENCVRVPKNLFNQPHPSLIKYEGDTFSRQGRFKKDKVHLYYLLRLNYSGPQISFEKHNIKKNTIVWEYESFIKDRLKRLLITDQKLVVLCVPSMAMVHNILQDEELNLYFRDESILQWLKNHCDIIMKMPNAIQHKITGHFLMVIRENYSKNNAPGETKKFDTLMQKTYDDAVEESIKEYQTSSKICKGLFCFSIIGFMITLYMPGGIDANFFLLMNAHTLPVMGIASFYFYKKDDSLHKEFSSLQRANATQQKD